MKTKQTNARQAGKVDRKEGSLWKIYHGWTTLQQIEINTIKVFTSFVNAIWDNLLFLEWVNCESCVKILGSIHWVNDSSPTPSKIPPPPWNVLTFFAWNSCCGISFFPWKHVWVRLEIEFSFKKLKLLCADIYFYQEDTDEDPESGRFLLLRIDCILFAKKYSKLILRDALRKHYKNCKTALKSKL